MILACDIGTTYTKWALLCNPREEKLGQPIVYTSHRKYLPLERQNGESWRALLQDIALILRLVSDPAYAAARFPGSCVSASDIATVRRLEALSFSSHGPSLLAIDRDGQPIASCHNPVHRTDPGLAQYRRGASFYLPLARALWDRLSLEQRGQVACILPPANYMCYLLGGALCVPIPRHYQNFYWPEATQEGTEAEIKINSSVKDAELLPLLPRLCDFSASVGRVQVSALRLHGLPPELEALPLFCPGVDFFAAEAGLSHSCDTLLRNRTGTSEGFNLFLPRHYTIDAEAKSLRNPPGYFLNYHVINKRPVLSYVQEGSGKLFGQLFELWQAYKQLPSGGLPAKPEPCSLAGFVKAETHANAPHCSAWQRSQENLMLQEIILNASSNELRRAEQYAQNFVQARHPISEFLSSLSDAFPVVEFPLLGLYGIQLLVQFFVWHSQIIFELYRQYSGRPFCQERQALLSGGQAYYPVWLNWKARQSGIVIHTPSICDAEFIGAAAICYYRLGYFDSIEMASKHLLKISYTYT